MTTLKKYERTEAQMDTQRPFSWKRRRRGQRIKRADRRDIKRQFLIRLDRNHAHISYTCTEIGIGRTTLYRWLRTDERFKQKYETVYYRFFARRPPISDEQHARNVAFLERLKYGYLDEIQPYTDMQSLSEAQLLRLATRRNMKV